MDDSTEVENLSMMLCLQMFCGHCMLASSGVTLARGDVIYLTSKWSFSHCLPHTPYNRNGL